MTKPIKLELKSLKIHDDVSEETLCFSAKLYVDGELAATVMNDGHGGSHRYAWTSREAEAAVEAHAKAQSLRFKFDLIDQVVDNLITEAEIAGKIQRGTKKATWFRLKGDKPGEWRVAKNVFDARVEQALRAKYGDKLDIIANKDFAGAVKHSLEAQKALDDEVCARYATV